MRIREGEKGGEKKITSFLWEQLKPCFHQSWPQSLCSCLSALCISKRLFTLSLPLEWPYSPMLLQERTGKQRHVQPASSPFFKNNNTAVWQLTVLKHGSLCLKHLCDRQDWDNTAIISLVCCLQELKKSISSVAIFWLFQNFSFQHQQYKSNVFENCLKSQR